MKEKVNYFDSSLKDRILGLPKDVLAKFLVLVDLLIECGAEPEIPNVIYLSDKLYRMKLFNTKMFVYYCQSAKNEITVLHISEKCDTLSLDFLNWLKARQMEVSHAEIPS